jgi:hypothetical protein
MLVLLAVPSGLKGGSLLGHLLNPDRQQAGSYKELQLGSTIALTW